MNKKLVQTRPEAIVACDGNGIINLCNPAFERFIERFFKGAAGAGDNIFAALPAETADAWRRAVSSLADSSPVSLHASYTAPDGGEVHYELAFAVFESGWSLFLRDITSCKNDELELRRAVKMLEEQLVEESNHIEANVLLAKEIAERKQAEENLTQIIQGNSIPTFVIDRHHRITHWNKALERLTGIKGTDIVGTNEQWKAFYTMERPTMADLILDQAPEEKIHTLYTGKYRASSLLEDSYEVEDFFELDGEGKWLFFTAAPLRSQSGEVIGAVETLQDITARKMMEQEILEYQNILENKVEERTLQLKKTYEQLLHAEKLSAVGKLAASIAHEFGNPIIGIRNFLKGLRATTELDQTDSELLDLAIQECQRVKDLISNLQDFNRPTSGTIEPMDLHKAINDMLLFCKKSFKENNIEVRKVFDPAVPEIYAVQDQLKQVILNCLNNAQEAINGSHGVITITTEARGDHVMLHIQDTGKGIKDEDLVNIFEPFFSTKPAVEGTGLGLSVSYGIMKRHQGNIEVTETSEKGTIFTISLPINGPVDELETF